MPSPLPDSADTEHNDYDKLDSYSLRQQIFGLLEKNHELTPKVMCQILHVPYPAKAQTIANYRREWRHNYRNRPGLKCLKFHRARYWLYCFRELMVARADAVKSGWQLSHARNRALLWADRQGLGRVEWFETGRVNVFVRKPASEARLKQLLANGFMWTGLISDVHVFEAWVRSARFKGAHATVDLGERLPYSRTEFLKDSNGVVVKTGDLSHETSVEIEFCYPDWGEKSELALKRIGSMLSEVLGLGKNGTETEKEGDPDYLV